MGLMRSVATIGGYTMLSRILGFARDALFAAVLGAGMAADAFMVAFRLPNFMRALFAEGAFNAAFVPLYSRILAGEDGPHRAARFAGEIASLLTLALLLLSAALMVFMPQAMLVLAPGFRDEPEKFALAVELTRLTFPYLTFISLVSLQGAVLNAHHRFGPPAATPVMMNLVLIAALLLPHDGLGLGLGVATTQAVAVSVAGMVQFVWLAVHMQRHGLAIRLHLPRFGPEIRRFFKLMGPAVIGAGIYQVNVLIDMILASLLPEGTVSYLFYADRLNQLPLAVIGIAISTALLPLLSRQLAGGETARALDTQNRALEGALLLTLPAAAALATLPETIVSVLFQRGAFSAADSAETAKALAVLACGLPAFTISKVFTPAFHAREDTRTPVRLALIALAVNLAVALAVMWDWHQAGLALASTVAAWANTAQLMVILRRRGYFKPDRRLVTRALRFLLATAVMVGVLLLLEWQLRPLFQRDILWRAGALAGLCASGGLVFLAVALASRAVTFGELTALVRRRSR
ncbi:murein biosynthesis integral membrane protein MurJ [Zavarzinia compransoris]|uniref:Probable lipid II flippase MurJ n=1 Tax=Zavarzinia compransoris TaxID=1264899 RepID=A0A317E728_9PROT|nr:murein biosynthesis integral membrane protein MurJ [Zavarzinia compransoris]PWR20875.1 murein biosynthesis integral membrane protein MurJ [Zavarzinia compransoris]TDP44289.1 putative peptidoglycan lipid II flippase [Zavarzinia compransoris]